MADKGTDIRSITGALGFGSYFDVRGRLSIADIFKPKKRCGLYALFFANGDGYIGRTIDVVRRFAGHRANHEDIAEIAFRPMSESEQDHEERLTIAACEARHVRLRNIQFVSVVIGETDLDLVLPPAQQAHWLRSYDHASHPLHRPNDESLRRRYEKRFTALEGRRQWPVMRSILQEYVATCLPIADRTELSFWSVSCLPGNLYRGRRQLARLNINWQEVMTAGTYADDGSVWFTFHVRRSILTEHGFEAPSFGSLVDHKYAPGGDDQVEIVADEAATGDVLSMIKGHAFRAAAKDFNLNLMRKGANNFARFHCFALADSILKPKHIPFRPVITDATPSLPKRW